MAIMWPQSSLLDGYTYLVITDENAEPIYAIYTNYLGNISFKNLPSDAAKPAGIEGFNPEDNLELYGGNGGYGYADYGQITIACGGNDYELKNPGEIRFNDELTELTIISNRHTYTAHIDNTSVITLQATSSISLALNMFESDAQYYYRAFHEDVNSLSLYTTSRNFWSMIPNDASLNLSLIVPTDKGMTRYPDVLSFRSETPTMFSMRQYHGNTYGIGYAYNPNTGEVGGALSINDSYSSNRRAIIVGNMLRSHTIYHDREEDKVLGLLSGNEFYVSMDGSVIHVLKENGKPTALQGIWQMDNVDAGLTTLQVADSVADVFAAGQSISQCNILEARTRDNGGLYLIDAPMEATTRTVHDILFPGGELAGEDSPYYEFAKVVQTLCMDSISSSLAAFKDGGLWGYYLNWVGVAPFTLFIPSNAAVQAEVKAGRLFQSSGAKLTEEQLKANAMFVRTHLMLGIEKADQLPFSRTHNTVLVKEGTLITPRLVIKSEGHGQMSVTDETGVTRNVVDNCKNVFVREVYLDSYTYYTNCEFATGVVHLIDGVLNYNR
ncbi:MAG: fasciclin domain-containing protein [Bacteroidaceae bacterium]|nr:fasciclin domain-containing protein [Bacteroidaceae bacterium]